MLVDAKTLDGMKLGVGASAVAESGVPSRKGGDDTVATNFPDAVVVDVGDEGVAA